MPEGDVAGIVAFGKDALVERLPAELAEIDRHRVHAGAVARPTSARRSGWRRALFPDDAQKRIVLISDGNDTTGGGQAEAALAAARGIQIETRTIGLGDGDEVLVERADDAIDRPPRRVDRGRRRHPLVGRPAGDGPAVRRTASSSRPQRVDARGRA